MSRQKRLYAVSILGKLVNSPRYSRAELFDGGSQEILPCGKVNKNRSVGDSCRSGDIGGPGGRQTVPRKTIQARHEKKAACADFLLLPCRFCRLITPNSMSIDSI